MGFQWKFSDNDLTRYFVFTVLPFGLSTATYIFTKTLKPLENYWRCNGVHIALFLDDGWITEEQASCKTLSNNIRSDLANAGFLINYEKSRWEPCQVIEWLGLIWNSKNGTIKITDKRVQTITRYIQKILENPNSVSER